MTTPGTRRARSDGVLPGCMMGILGMCLVSLVCFLGSTHFLSRDLREKKRHVLLPYQGLHG